MSILSETQHFIRLFLHHIGKSEIPEAYLLWSSLSLLAGCVADRVWFEKFVGKKLAPNLYVMLIGNPGSGKDTAIESALRLITENKRINLLHGRVTAPHLIDYLAGIKRDGTGKPMRVKVEEKREIKGAKLYLAMPEFAMCVGSGQNADTMIKFMTGVYGGSSIPIYDGTRMYGSVTVKESCFNWLVGTTRRWLTNAVSRDAIEGGFFARFAPVVADFDPDLRIRQPMPPVDYEEVTAHLIERTRELSYIGGRFYMTPEAERVDEQWYSTRESPNDDLIFPFWRRQHDLVIKIAMLLSLAEGTYDFLIRSEHVGRAQWLTDEIKKTLPMLMSLAAATRDTEHIDVVERVIRRAKQIPRYLLMRQCSARGIHRQRLDEAIEALVQQKKVTRGPGPQGGVVYSWIDIKRHLRLVGSEE